MGFDTAVAIVTHQRPQILRRTLQSLQACNLPDGVREIVVIENGAADCGSAELCRSAGLPLPIRHLFLADRRKTAALNIALEQIAASFVCFFDDDVRLDGECLAAYAAAAAHYGLGHFFGGPHGTEGGNPPPAWLQRWLPLSAGPWQAGGREEVLTPKPGFTMFMGFNWAAFQADLQAAGGFATYLPSHGDETVMQRRLMTRGALPVYLPSARVWHLVPDQRCSYEFAVQRARAFSRNSLVMHHVENKLRSPALPPRWLLRQALENYLGFYAAKLSGNAGADLIEHELKLANTKGTLDGYRLLRTFAHAELAESSRQVHPAVAGARAFRAKLE
jgi:GT2 family glycosyltransferase